MTLVTRLRSSLTLTPLGSHAKLLTGADVSRSEKSGGFEPIHGRRTPVRYEGFAVSLVWELTCGGDGLPGKGYKFLCGRG